MLKEKIFDYNYRLDQTIKRCRKVLATNDDMEGLPNTFQDLLEPLIFNKMANDIIAERAKNGQRKLHMLAAMIQGSRVKGFESPIDDCNLLELNSIIKETLNTSEAYCFLVESEKMCVGNLKNLDESGFFGNQSSSYGLLNAVLFTKKTGSLLASKIELKNQILSLMPDNMDDETKKLVSSLLAEDFSNFPVGDKKKIVWKDSIDSIKSSFQKMLSYQKEEEPGEERSEVFSEAGNTEFDMMDNLTGIFAVINLLMVLNLILMKVTSSANRISEMKKYPYIRDSPLALGVINVIDRYAGNKEFLAMIVFLVATTCAISVQSYEGKETVSNVAKYLDYMSGVNLDHLDVKNIGNNTTTMELFMKTQVIAVQNVTGNSTLGESLIRTPRENVGDYYNLIFNNLSEPLRFAYGSLAVITGALSLKNRPERAVLLILMLVLNELQAEQFLISMVQKIGPVTLVTGYLILQFFLHLVPEQFRRAREHMKTRIAKSNPSQNYFVAGIDPENKFTGLDKQFKKVVKAESASSSNLISATLSYFGLFENIPTASILLIQSIFASIKGVVSKTVSIDSKVLSQIDIFGKRRDVWTETSLRWFENAKLLTSYLAFLYIKGSLAVLSSYTFGFSNSFLAGSSPNSFAAFLSQCQSSPLKVTMEGLIVDIIQDAFKSASPLTWIPILFDKAYEYAQIDEIRNCFITPQDPKDIDILTRTSKEIADYSLLRRRVPSDQKYFTDMKTARITFMNI